MGLTTTTIGSYPKPEYLRIPNFVPKHPDPTQRYQEYLASRTAEDDELLLRATADNIHHQVEAGIDIPTDGETPRSHYVHYHLQQLGGVDFENLSDRTTRGGAWTAKFPTIVSPVEAGAAFLPTDWKRAQATTSQPVKMTMPGPLTIMDSTVDQHYRDPRRLGADLADVLNIEVRRLAAAGCKHIQVDEPVFARQADVACDWAIDLLDRIFDGISQDVQKTVHICCGYPSGLDLEDFPKAPREAYFALAKRLEQTRIDVVSIEDAHRHNNLSLLEAFPSKSVILGTVQIANTRVETADEIEARLRAALEHIDASRLLAGPDCGLAMLPRELVSEKLRALTTAAARIVA